MKILLIHNSYAQPAGGEDAVFEAESALLRSHGHQVIQFTGSNKEILEKGRFAALQSLFSSVYNHQVYREVKDLCDREKPAVVHIHNFWFALSPALHSACHDSCIPVVQTLHNFRLVCLGALLVRNGRVCRDCVGKTTWRGIFHRCYNHSLLLSSFLHRMVRNRERLYCNTDVFIALSDFGRDVYVEGGMPAEKLLDKPNFVPDVDVADAAPRTSTHVLYVGRLSKEKGVDVLINAWTMLSARFNEGAAAKASLTVLGEGPEKEWLIKSSDVCSELKRVVVEGHLEKQEVVNKMAESGFLVFPSVWYEGMPMTMLEAYACGLPIVASRMGAMQEIVSEGETGLLFEPGNAEDLAEKMGWMLTHPDECRRMGANARREYEEKYSPEKNYQMLKQIYQTAISRRAEG